MSSWTSRHGRRYPGSRPPPGPRQAALARGRPTVPWPSWKAGVRSARVFSQRNQDLAEVSRFCGPPPPRPGLSSLLEASVAAPPPLPWKPLGLPGPPSLLSRLAPSLRAGSCPEAPRAPTAGRPTGSAALVLERSEGARPPAAPARCCASGRGAPQPRPLPPPTPAPSRLLSPRGCSARTRRHRQLMYLSGPRFPH